MWAGTGSRCKEARRGPAAGQCQRSGSAMRDRGDEPSRAVPAAAAIRLRVQVRAARVPRLNGSAAASTVRTTGRVRGKRGLLATIDAQRRVPIMSIRSPPSASRSTCKQISPAPVCAIHALGLRPACMKHGTKMRRRRLFLALQGLAPAWGVSPAGPGQDRYGRLGRRHLVMKLETTTLETRPCPYIVASSAACVP